MYVSCEGTCGAPNASQILHVVIRALIWCSFRINGFAPVPRRWHAASLKHSQRWTLLIPYHTLPYHTYAHRCLTQPCYRSHQMHTPAPRQTLSSIGFLCCRRTRTRLQRRIGARYGVTKAFVPLATPSTLTSSSLPQRPDKHGACAAADFEASPLASPTPHIPCRPSPQLRPHAVSPVATLVRRPKGHIIGSIPPTRLSQ